MKVEYGEIVLDTYNEIIKAEKEDNIYISRYGNMSNVKKNSIKNMIIQQYLKDDDLYKKFLETKFTFLIKKLSKMKVIKYKEK